MTTNGEANRNVECERNLPAVQKAATNEGTDMVFIEKRLQFPLNPAMKHFVVLKANILVKKLTKWG